MSGITWAVAPADSSGFAPWIAAGALVVAGVALRRRPRRILVLCLALLLTPFAFECETREKISIQAGDTGDRGRSGSDARRNDTPRA